MKYQTYSRLMVSVGTESPKSVYDRTNECRNIEFLTNTFIICFYYISKIELLKNVLKLLVELLLILILLYIYIFMKLLVIFHTNFILSII